MTYSRMGQLLMSVVAALAAGATACASPSPSAAPTADENYVITRLQERSEMVSGSRPFNDLTDLLTNVSFSLADGTPAPLTEAVVVGRIQKVEKGRSFYVEGADASEGIESAYDDSRGLWRTVHVTLLVDTSVSATAKADSTVIVGFAFGADATFAEISDSFLAMQDLLLFLTETPVFDYAPDVWGTVADGALLGLVSSDGNISLPVQSQSSAEALLRPAPTIASLQLAASKPTRVILLDATGVRVG